MNIKYIAIPKDLLDHVDSLLSCMWHRGGLNEEFKSTEVVEYEKIIAKLRAYTKGDKVL